MGEKYYASFANQSYFSVDDVCVSWDSKRDRILSENQPKREIIRRRSSSNSNSGCWRRRRRRRKIMMILWVVAKKNCTMVISSSLLKCVLILMVARGVCSGEWILMKNQRWFSILFFSFYLAPASLPILQHQHHRHRCYCFVISEWYRLCVYFPANLIMLGS